MSSSHHPSTPSWQESLDPAFVARLSRPLTRPGLISRSLSRRILATLDYFAGRRSLVDDLSRRRGRAGENDGERPPIVHARWWADSITVVPVVERTDTRVVERIVVQAATAKAGMHREAPVTAPSPSRLRVSAVTPSVPQVVAIDPSASPARRAEMERWPSIAAPKPSPVSAAGASRLEGKRLERPLAIRPSRAALLARAEESRAVVTSHPMMGHTRPVPPPPIIEAPRAGTVEVAATPTHVIEIARVSQTDIISRALPVVRARDPEMLRSVVTDRREINKAVMVPSPAVALDLPRSVPIVAPTAPRASAAGQSALVHANGRAQAGGGVLSPSSAPAASGRSFVDAGPSPRPRAMHAPASAPVSGTGALPAPNGPVPLHRDMQSAAAAASVDIDRIVDEVGRKLVRRLSAERERRGGLR
ncbi:Extensin-like protein precursor [Minicystis rosea]|nr:Extensin-like protein precursor [Minicystis rosea]